MFSSEESDRLRGPQFGAAWCDELAAWRNVRETWDNLQFGLRLGRNPRQVITTTPRPIPLLKELLRPGRLDVVVTRGATRDNAANLAESFLGQIVGRYAGTRLGRQELEGELLQDIEGALWTGELIEKGRIDKSALPELKRIVVAIDPAMTTGEAANESGLIVAGVDDRDHAYILEDASGKYAPIEWARAAVKLYHNHTADRIVAEVNQGGAMVESTIRMVDPNVAYKAVSASRGKITRAEPVAALYEQGRVHHVGIFPELEDQLCSFAPGMPGSPDRGDALVWALTQLLVENRNSSLGFLNFYAGLAGGGVAVPGGSPLERVVLLKPPAGCGGAHLLSGRNINTWGEPVAMLESDARPLLASGWSRAPSNLSPQ